MEKMYQPHRVGAIGIDPNGQGPTHSAGWGEGVGLVIQLACNKALEHGQASAHGFAVGHQARVDEDVSKSFKSIIGQ